MSTETAVSPGMMADADHAEPNYIAIWIYLAVLTVLELVVAYAPIPKAAMVGGLIGLAFAKAILVAMYFMHLRFERRTLAIIACIPIILVTDLCPPSHGRGGQDGTCAGQGRLRPQSQCAIRAPQKIPE
jgi:cytochrome c oxidase subunit 4